MKPTTINAIIVDDEPLAHEVLELHLHTLAHASSVQSKPGEQTTPNVHIQQRCYNATEALAWLANNTTDLMFLDINMPGLSGLELLKVIANRPQVILISAYSEFALQGFELDVVDYLLKPVSAERLQTALDKVLSRQNQASLPPSPNAMPATLSPADMLPKYIVVQVDRAQHKVKVRDIVWLEAYGNYVKLWLEGNMLLVTSTLKQLLTELQGACAQVHKSYAVNINKITAVDSEFVVLAAPSQVKVKIGKSYKQEVKALLRSGN